MTFDINNLPQEMIDAIQSTEGVNGFIPLIREGDTFKGGRKIPIERDSILQGVKNFNDAGRPLVIKHGKHEGSPDAAGWIKNLIPLEVDGKQWIYAGVEWNEDGHEAVTSKKHRFISPEFIPQSTSKADGTNIGFEFIGAALLNNPQLDMPSAEAFDGEQESYYLTDATEIPYYDKSDMTNISDNSNQSNKPGETDMDLIKIAEALTCSATEVEVLAAINKLNQDSAEKLSADTSKIEELTAKVEQFDSLTAQVETLTSELEAEKAKVLQVETPTTQLL